MLRSFVYNPKFSQLADALERFGFDLSKKEHSLTLVRFEVITPDSFMWRILVGNAIYYLYAEDYAPGVEYINKLFTAYIGSNKWELVAVVNPKSFKSSSPVKAASVYKEHKNSDEMMKYAADSGPDFIFLAKSQEDPDNVQFSDWTPTGFDRSIVI